MSFRTHALKAAACAFACGLALTLAATPASAAQAPIGSEFLVNTTTIGNQIQPAVSSAADGRFVVVWDGETAGGSLNDIYAQRFSANGEKLGAEVRVNTDIGERQGNPAVAMDAQGNYVVIWDSAKHTAAGTGKYARAFYADGTPRGDQFKVNSSGRDLYPLVAAAMDGNGNFALAWPERASTGSPIATNISLSYIMVQRYWADGTPNGAAIIVDQAYLTTFRVPTIGMDAQGGFVVAWNSASQAGFATKESALGYGLGIFARRFGADGQPLGNSFRVNADTALITVKDDPMIYDRPVVAVASNGSFAVAWQTNGQDLVPTGISLRRYNASGTPMTPPTTIDAPRLSRKPALAFGLNGELVVAAHSDGLYVRAYAPNGQARGASLRADSGAASGKVLQPAVTVDSFGRFVAVWQTFGQDGSGRGIYARRFSAP